MQYKSIQSIGLIGLTVIFAVQARAQLTLEQLKERIQTRGLTSVEEVIASLPAAFRRNYVLLHASSSIQGASPEAPRVLMYGDDAKLVLTFNGGGYARGGDSLEMIAFNARTRSFELAEVHFAGGYDGDARGTPKFSETNPSRCLGCHGFTEPRPLWESYGYWPGAFGERPEHASQSESEALRRFQKLAGAHFRYRHLTALPSHTPSSLAAANAALTRHFSRLNRFRLARLIRASPAYSPFRFAVQSVLAGCGAPEDVMPAERVRTHSPRTSLEVIEDTRKRIVGSGVATDRAYDLSQAELTGRLRYVLEPLKIDFREGTLSLDRESYRFADGADGLAGLTGPLWALPRDCAVLKRLSLESLRLGE